MKKMAIVGGETHLDEVIRLAGKAFDIVGTCMKEDQRKSALPDSTVPNFSSADRMLAEIHPEIVAIANENDLKFAAILKALEAGCDVIADKPLCITMSDQQCLEKTLAAHPERRLLNLLTLRGSPGWTALHDLVRSDVVGRPAFVHVRMAVQLKRARRPAWFLDSRRSGGLFLDLLIHGLDQVEWLTGTRIAALTAGVGNLGDPSDPFLQDHAAVFCELDNGGSAVVEGQRMLPGSLGSDYRVLVAGSGGMADLIMAPLMLRVTDEQKSARIIESFPEPKSVVADWLNQDSLP